MLVASAWLRSDNQMRTRLSYISWLPGWHSEYEEQSRKTKSQDLTCPGPQSDQRIRSPVGNHDHWPVWPTHFTSTQWLQFLDIKQKSDKSARIFGDYSQDLNLSLSRLTKFQSCRLLSTTIHIRWLPKGQQGYCSNGKTNHPLYSLPIKTSSWIIIIW